MCLPIMCERIEEACRQNDPNAMTANATAAIHAQRWMMPSLSPALPRSDGRPVGERVLTDRRHLSKGRPGQESRVATMEQ